MKSRESGKIKRSGGDLRRLTKKRILQVRVGGIMWEITAMGTLVCGLQWMCLQKRGFERGFNMTSP